MFKVLNNVLKAVLSPLDDKRVSVPLSVLLVLYSGLIAPEPPALLEDLMKSPVARLVALAVLSLIMAKGDLNLAILSTVAIVLTLGLASRPKVVYHVVNTAKGVVGKATNVAGDVVDAVGDVVFGDDDEPKGNQLDNVVGV